MNDAFAASERRHLEEPDPECEVCHDPGAPVIGGKYGNICDDCHNDRRLAGEWSFCDVLGCQYDAEPDSILCARHEDDVHEHRENHS